MKKLLYSLIIFSLSYLGSLHAQDPVFSNPMLSPGNLNPALTGVSNYQSRLQLVIRNQYAFLGREAFNTVSVAYDQQFASGKHNFIGAGVAVLADRAGALGFSTIHAKLSGSFIKRLSAYRNRSSYLSAGAEFGWLQKRVDLTEARWGSQHNGKGEFDPDLFSGADYLDLSSRASMDMGAGLLFLISDEKNAKSFYAGAALYHLNGGNESFSSSSNSPVNRRIALHTGGEFPLDNNLKKLRLLPQVAFQSQGNSLQLLGGMDARYILVGDNYDKVFIQFGSALRLVNKIEEGLAGDALVVKGRMDYNKLSVGVSYDVTLSKLRAAGAGAWEIGILYHFEGDDTRIICPKFSRI